LKRNQIVIEGVIAGKESLRYSPAGVPVLKFQLEHQSTQAEAGNQFKVQLQLEVWMSGEAAQAVSRLAEGSSIMVKGFLCQHHQGSTLTVLRAEQYKLMIGD
jgi:primosomal replication protein N